MKKTERAKGVKDMKEYKAPQKAKRLCIHRSTEDINTISVDEEHYDQTVKIVIVEDKKEDQLMECCFKVTPQMVEERVKAMKDYLLGIASVQDTPLPHLKCHQALLLLGG